MQSHSGCAVPEEYLFDLELDSWVRIEAAGTALFGMTDVAQTLCGRLASVTFKPVGRRVARGRTLAVIESAKWVGPFKAPLSGEIVEVNADSVLSDPVIVNRDPYGAGWLVRISPDRLDEERGGLIDGVEAFPHIRRRIEEEEITCMRCAD